MFGSPLETIPDTLEGIQKEEREKRAAVVAISFWLIGLLMGAGIVLFILDLQGYFN